MISRVNPSARLSVFILSHSPSLYLTHHIISEPAQVIDSPNVAKIDDLHIFCQIEITLIQCSMSDFYGFLTDLFSSWSVD